MTHYTLNTGDRRESPRSEVADEAIETLRPLSLSGGPLPQPFGAFLVEIVCSAGGAVFTVSTGESADCGTCGLAWTERGGAEVWPAIEDLYLKLSDSAPQLTAATHSPEQPKSLPWLAVVLLPGLGLTSQQDVGWLGDFERCLAWAMIEQGA